MTWRSWRADTARNWPRFFQSTGSPEKSSGKAHGTRALGWRLIGASILKVVTGQAAGAPCRLWQISSLPASSSPAPQASQKLVGTSLRR